ncbi:MAG: hypothetical protein ABF289_01655 [Clostridiales bacterium]
MNLQIIIIISSFSAFLLFGFGMYFSIKKHEKNMKSSRGKRRLKYSNNNSSK